MHKRQGAFKTVGSQLGSQRLAGMGRVDYQCLAGKVFLPVFFSVYPVLNPVYFFGCGLDYLLYFES